MEQLGKFYTYETKCRRCCSLNEWYFGSSDSISYGDFIETMIDYTEHPRSRNCEKCEKQTVQDLVSYTPIGGEKEKH